jgi:hypothetical protein
MSFTHKRAEINQFCCTKERKNFHRRYVDITKGKGSLEFIAYPFSTNKADRKSLQIKYGRFIKRKL